MHFIHIRYSCSFFTFITVEHFIVWIYHDIDIRPTADRLWVLSILGLQWIMLLWTFLYMCFDANQSAFLLSIHLRNKLSIFSVSRYCHFREVVVLMFTPASSVWKFCFLYMLMNTNYYLFTFNHYDGGIMVSHCVCVFVRFCTSLITNEVAHHFPFYWPFKYLPM